MLTTRTVLIALLLGAAVVPVAAHGIAAQIATAATADTCESVARSKAESTPRAMMGDMASMDLGTPVAETDHTTNDLDRAYIDMMIPHHASMIALADAALPRLTDERLREIAQAVVATQQPEIAELRGYREAFFGEAEPMPMEDATMAAMVELMPGMTGTMEEMAFQMETAAQVAAFCAADDADLAFIDQTIPHHRMAIEASEVAWERAVHPELRDFAQRVIDAQQREIETLTEIRGEIAGAATPAGS